MDRFTEVFLAYQAHVNISENALMTAAIMKAIRCLPTEEEQIRVLEGMLPIRTLAAHLGGRNIDVNPIFAELSKMSGQEPLSAANSMIVAPKSAVGPQTSAIQGPLSNLPRMRRLAPKPVGNNPVADDNTKQEQEPEKTLPETQAPAPQKKTVMMRRRMTHGLKPDVSHQNNVDEETGSDASSVDESQTSEVSEDKPTFLSKIRAPFGKMFGKKEGGETAEPKMKERREQARPQGKTKVGGKSLILGLGIGVTLVLIVLVFLSASLMSSQNFSPNVAEVPLGSAESLQDNTSAPVYVPDEAEMILELTEPMLKKPVNFEDFTNNFPLRWLLWIGFLLPLFNQLKQDRFAAAEKTDLVSISIGILAMLLLTVFSGTVSTFVSSYLVTTQMSTYPADFQATTNNLISGVIEALMVIMGVAFNLGMQLSASQSGKRDYSALAVGGFFSTGVILVWWYSGHSLIVSLGWLMMCLGMYVQAREMSKTYQGGGAIVVSFIMIAFFFLGFVVSSFAMKYVVQLDLPEILAYAVYKSSLAVSVFFGGLISWSGGDYIATNILPPKKLAEDSDGEDSSASIAELPVTVKYDAMAFGMMIMYPLVSIWWYVSALVSTFS